MTGGQTINFVQNGKPKLRIYNLETIGFPRFARDKKQQEKDKPSISFRMANRNCESKISRP
jgi:hypothetical protein